MNGALILAGIGDILNIYNRYKCKSNCNCRIGKQVNAVIYN